jgi:hypothetical protein
MIKSEQQQEPVDVFESLWTTTKWPLFGNHHFGIGNLNKPPEAHQ